MTSESGRNKTFSVTYETFSILGDIFLKNPKIVDGMGEKIISGKCNKSGAEKKIRVAELAILEFENKDGDIKSISLSGYPSYEIQYGIYQLEGE
jgi:hypothetical protein